MVEIIDADSRIVIGRVQARNEGNFKLRLRLDLVPCAIQAQVREPLESMSVRTPVDGAPPNCSPGGATTLRL